MGGGGGGADDTYFLTVQPPNREQFFFDRHHAPLVLKKYDHPHLKSHLSHTPLAWVYNSGTALNSWWLKYLKTHPGQNLPFKVNLHTSVLQITTLVNHKERPRVSDKAAKALIRVGHAVNVAVEKFVLVGQSIAEENDEIRNDMCEACQEARSAGLNLHVLFDPFDHPHLTSVIS